MKLETSSRTLLVLSSSDGAAATRAATPTRSTTRRVIVTASTFGQSRDCPPDCPHRKSLDCVPPGTTRAARRRPSSEAMRRGSAPQLERPGAEAMRCHEQDTAIREDRHVRHRDCGEPWARGPPLVAAAERPAAAEAQLDHA